MRIYGLDVNGNSSIKRKPKSIRKKGYNGRSRQIEIDSSKKFLEYVYNE